MSDHKDPMGPSFDEGFESTEHTDDGALWAFVQDGLDGAEADAIAMHLAGCDRCVQAIDGFSEVAATLHAVHEAPSDLARVRGRRRLDQALREEALVARRRGFKGPRVMLVAAMAAFAGAAAATVAGSDAVRSLLFERQAAVQAPAHAVPELSEEPTATVPAAVQTELAEAEPEPSIEAEIEIEETLSATPAESDRAQRTKPAARAAKKAPSRASAARTPAPVEAPSAEPRPALAAGPDEAIPDGTRVARADGTPTSREAYEAAREALHGRSADDPAWLAVGDLAAMAGDVQAAAQTYANMLSGEKATVAAERLEKLVQAGALKAPAAERLLKGDDGAEAMRLRCAWGLRYRGDRAAVSVCQSFGRQFPQHPAVRMLALSAGRTAEFKVHDLALAEEEYSRAILVSQYAGVPGTSALLARARCRAKRRNLDEARADLRLFLHVQPEARWRDDVMALGQQLGVDVQREAAAGE